MPTEPDEAKPLSFWQRQFTGELTGDQLAFDLSAGVVLPLVCLVFDPIVFQASFGEPMVGRYSLAGYLTVGIGISSLIAWIWFRRPAALFAGVLAGGAVFSFLLGLALLPLSLFFLVILIGAPGLSPLLTAFVFLRNATRAYSIARQQGGSIRLIALAAPGFFISLVGPWAVQATRDAQLSVAVDMVVSEDPSKAAQGLAAIKRWRLFVDLDPLVWAYEKENDPVRRARIEKVYDELTGDSMSSRLARLHD